MMGKGFWKRFGSCAALAGALLLCGCASQAPEPEATEFDAAEEDPGYTIVGTQTDESADVLVTNDLGNPITALSLTTTGSTDPAENLMEEGVSIADKEQFLFYYVPAQATAKTDDSADAKTDDSADAKTDDSADAKADEAVQYKMTATLSDGTIYDFPGLELADYKDMALTVGDDKLSYATYVTTDGKTGDTLAASKEAVDAAAKAAAPAEDQTATDAQRDNDSVEDRSVAQDTVYESSSSSGSSSGYSGGGSDYSYSYDYGASTGSGGGSADTNTGSSGSSGADTGSGAGTDNGSSSGPAQGEDSCINPDDIIFKD